MSDIDVTSSSCHGSQTSENNSTSTLSIRTSISDGSDQAKMYLAAKGQRHDALPGQPFRLRQPPRQHLVAVIVALRTHYPSGMLVGCAPWP